MKKWLIIFAVIFFAGGISSAVLAGKIYYKELKVYEDYDRKELSVKEAQNVYIKSDVPIELHSTNENNGYAEFTQRFVDLVGFKPKYALEVEERGDDLYISVNKVKEVVFLPVVKEDKAKLIVYLPQKDLAHLEIEDQYFNSLNRQDHMIDLSGANVKEVEINIRNGDICLDGAYESINIHALHYGVLSVNSTIPAQLYTSGAIEQHLNGKFERIVVKDNSSDIRIDSLIPSNVEIDNNCGILKLDGQYSKVRILGVQNKIELNSDAECTLLTKGGYNYITAVGLFKSTSIEGYDNDIEIQNMIIPESVKMIGESSEGSVKLTLPSNTPGISLNYVSKDGLSDNYYGDNYEEEKYEYSVSSEDARHLESDFPLISVGQQNGRFTYTYGNGQVPITINANRDIEVSLIDGGYSSILEK